MYIMHVKSSFQIQRAQKPRGRLEFSNKGKPLLYKNINIGEEFIPIIMEQFGLNDKPIIHYDGSKHYKCYLD